ncbi:hypothetical protein BDZ91DRAFT_798016 [Kalaharituber pfeilii]|nr:hypothetical protein BDZ91DRAFT_798016 [Kalaharituber pfeilii]
MGKNWKRKAENGEEYDILENFFSGVKFWKLGEQGRRRDEAMYYPSQDREGRLARMSLVRTGTGKPEPHHDGLLGMEEENTWRIRGPENTAEDKGEEEGVEGDLLTEILTWAGQD